MKTIDLKIPIVWENLLEKNNSQITNLPITINDSTVGYISSDLTSIDLSGVIFGRFMRIVPEFQIEESDKIKIVGFKFDINVEGFKTIDKDKELLDRILKGERYEY